MKRFDRRLLVQIYKQIQKGSKLAATNVLMGSLGAREAEIQNGLRRLHTSGYCTLVPSGNRGYLGARLSAKQLDYCEMSWSKKAFRVLRLPFKLALKAISALLLLLLP